MKQSLHGLKKLNRAEKLLLVIGVLMIFLVMASGSTASKAQNASASARTSNF